MPRFPVQPVSCPGGREELEDAGVRMTWIDRLPDFAERPHAEERFEFPLLNLLVRLPLGGNVLKQLLDELGGPQDAADRFAVR